MTGQAPTRFLLHPFASVRSSTARQTATGRSGELNRHSQESSQ